MTKQTKTIIRVNDPLDLEVIIPEPISEGSEFYYFPKDKRLAITRAGQVMNVKTGKILKGVVSRLNKRSVFSFNLRFNYSYFAYYISMPGYFECFRMHLCHCAQPGQPLGFDIFYAVYSSIIRG